MLVLINGGGTSMPDNTQDDWDSSEESVDEEATHAEVEDRMEEESDCSEVVREGDEAEVMEDLLLVPQRRTISQGFASLDCVNLEEVFQVRAPVMKTVLMVFRAALKVGLEEIRRGQSTRPEDGNCFYCCGCCYTVHPEEA